MKKKIMSLILMSAVIASASFTALATPASASTLNNQKPSINSSINEFSTQDLIDEIQPYVVVDANGKLSLSPSVPNKLYKKYNLDLLEKRFEELNKQVSNGEISIKPDLTIKENKTTPEHSHSLMLAASSGTIGISKSCDGTCTRDTYWWGQSLGYDPACAKEAIYKAKQTALSIGVIGAYSKSYITAIPAWWWNSWANDMQYNLGSNGVTCDLNYTIVKYNCYSR